MSVCAFKRPLIFQVSKVKKSHHIKTNVVIFRRNERVIFVYPEYKETDNRKSLFVFV